jgi:hypothetical protein
MNDIISKMLQRPIATIIIVGSFGRAIANIIAAAKGTPIGPMISIQNTKSV